MDNTRYSLKILQQPNKARLCSFKEKVDRRPIDPPPIVQILCNEPSDDLLTDPYFFLYATLSDMSGNSELHFINDNRTTAGAVVQSLHKLKNTDNTEGGFFIFSDISVRLEGIYRLKFTLFRIEGESVQTLKSTLSDPFQVYAPKIFPGMSESTILTRHFSEQGVRIRIRKEPRSSTTGYCLKRRRTNSAASDEDSMQSSKRCLPELSHTPYFGGLPSPQDLIEPSLSLHSAFKPNLPSPKLFKSTAMSVKNILSDDNSELYPAKKESGLFLTRKLPLPIPLLQDHQRLQYQNGTSSFTFGHKLSSR
ncbi:unnamed protein product [Rhizopus stolonifer]